MQLVSQSAQDTQMIAAELAARLLAGLAGRSKATIVALRGELGAGKTTFTQGFARALGIIERPKSPTFMLVKQYAIPGTDFSLWHLDCYRLNGRQDVVALDLRAVFGDPHNLVLIEWPERIGDGLPRDHVDIHMSHQEGDKRAITIKE
jgi:tRNA threonylcarbamoyladenosine biosynthesis protein TsaE